MYVISSRAQV